MPKIIEGLRQSILDESRAMLLASGYEALTVRAVAQRCGVAVGTVYNYFSSKDMLIAAVMLEDWQRALARMQAETAGAASLENGLRIIFEGLRAFGGTYRNAWTQYTAMGGALISLRERHHMLIGQLIAVLHPMCEALELAPRPVCMEIAASTLLSYSLEDGRDFEGVTPALLKLLT